MLLKKWCLWLWVLAAMVAAEESASDLKINAWGWYTFGKVGSGFSQLNNSTEADVDFTDYWLTDFNGGIRLEKNFDGGLKFRLNAGFTTAFQVLDRRNTSKDFLVRKFVPYLIDAAVERTFAINEKDRLLLEFGYLPVRYNPQAANLGEYLFGRTTPYPAVVQSGFELADKEKAPGFHLSYTLNFLNKSTLKLDNYIYTEMKQWPIGDISEAFLVAVNTEQFFEFGCGLNYHHLISVDERQTTPGADSIRLDAQPERYSYQKRVIAAGDTTWDTTLYTARGLKLMARFTLNPRVFIPWSGFGPEDLKIFAEAAILGVQNYDGWYENRKERIPVMFGFNFPTFKLLDVLSFQMQWFGTKYYNSWENLNKEGSFVPYVGTRNPLLTPENFRADSTMVSTVDDWKWSIYMSKKINNRIRLSLQFANDNTFKNPYNPPPPAVIKYTEITRRTWAVKDGKEQFFQIWDWYWMGRIMFSF